MLYFLAEEIVRQGGPPVFTYSTTRALLGFLTALLISILIGRPTIKWLFQNGYRDFPRNYGAISISNKEGTPTMGGLIMLLSSCASMFLWCDLLNLRTWLVLASIVIFAFLGFIDDKAKRDNKSADGGASRIVKIIPQVLFGIGLGVVALFPQFDLFPEINGVYIGDMWCLPFIKNPILHLSWFLPVWGLMWSGGITNAVNYTDGLDGMLSVPAFFALLVLGVYAFVMGNSVLAEYLHFPFIHGVGELAVICSIFMGCCLGFLWFNSFPAEVFMGDLGSLMLGGVMMTVSFLLRQEWLFLLVGGIFIFEFMTSVVQDYYFLKRKGRRFFRQAPFHRSLKNGHGIAEPKVVVRYWIVAALLAAIGLIALKLR